MNQFPWMENVLRLMTVDELRDLGVTVYQAPKVPKRAKVVNLMNGVVVDFGLEGEMPSTGAYAKHDELLALAQRYDLDLVEQNRILYPSDVDGTSDLSDPDAAGAPVEVGAEAGG